MFSRGRFGERADLFRLWGSSVYSEVDLLLCASGGLGVGCRGTISDFWLVTDCSSQPCRVREEEACTVGLKMLIGPLGMAMIRKIKETKHLPCTPPPHANAGSGSPKDQKDSAMAVQGLIRSNSNHCGVRTEPVAFPCGSE